jgi:hypothetical protein
MAVVTRRESQGLLRRPLQGLSRLQRVIWRALCCQGRRRQAAAAGPAIQQPPSHLRRAVLDRD